MFFKHDWITGHAFPIGLISILLILKLLTVLFLQGLQKIFKLDGRKDKNKVIKINYIYKFYKIPVKNKFIKS